LCDVPACIRHHNRIADRIERGFELRLRPPRFGQQFALPAQRGFK
jgi:hypothetical protein